MTAFDSLGASGIIALVVSCAIAYFLCGIPFGYVVGRRLGKIDVRTQGSGNVGATNVARTVGKGAGLLTLALDILKALVSLLVGKAILTWALGAEAGQLAFGSGLDWMPCVVYMFAILGHTFSPYLHLRGGKGIAVGFGGALGFMPLVALLLWVPFLVFALITRRVSVGSIAAAISLPLLAWAVYRPTAASLAILSVVAALVLFSHRSNIVKLIHGEERPFSFKR